MSPTFPAVIGDFEVQMVEYVESIILAIPNIAGLFGMTFLRDIAADGKSTRAELFAFGIFVAQRDGHVIDNPMLVVIQNHAFHQPLEIFLLFFIGRGILLFANELTSYFLQKVELERWSNADESDDREKGESNNELCKVMDGYVRQRELDRDSLPEIVPHRRCRN